MDHSRNNSAFQPPLTSAGSITVDVPQPSNENTAVPSEIRENDNYDYNFQRLVERGATAADLGFTSLGQDVPQGETSENDDEEQERIRLLSIAYLSLREEKGNDFDAYIEGIIAELEHRPLPRP